MEKRCPNQPFLILMQTSKAIQERIKSEMTKYKLNITEFSVLETLYQMGKQTIQQICNNVLISSGSMTYVIDKLEQKGLLMRSACPDDRRAIHVSLTDHGMDTMNNIMPKYHELVKNMFSSLSHDEQDLLVQSLEKIKNNVED